MTFILIHPPLGSPYFEVMIAFVTNFGLTAGTMVAINYRGLAERLRAATTADRRRFGLRVGWLESRPAFIRLWGTLVALVSCIGFVGGALGYARDMLDVCLLTMGAADGILIAVDVSRKG